MTTKQQIKQNLSFMDLAPLMDLEAPKETKLKETPKQPNTRPLFDEVDSNDKWRSI